MESKKEKNWNVANKRENQSGTRYNQQKKGNLRNKFLIWLKHRVLRTTRSWLISPAKLGRLPIKNGPPSCHQLK